MAIKMSETGGCRFRDVELLVAPEHRTGRRKQPSFAYPAGALLYLRVIPTLAALLLNGADAYDFVRRATLAPLGIVSMPRT
jgi:hypothetical protein